MRSHDRQTDPDETNVARPERPGDGGDAGGVKLLPARREHIDIAGAVADRLTIVGADDDDREVDSFAGGQQVARGFGPIEIIVAHKAAVLPRLAQHADVGPLGEGLDQALPQHLPQRIADHRDIERRPARLGGPRRRGRLGNRRRKSGSDGRGLRRRA